MIPRNRIRLLNLYPSKCRCRQAATEEEIYHPHTPLTQSVTAAVRKRKSEREGVVLVEISCHLARFATLLPLCQALARIYGDFDRNLEKKKEGRHATRAQAILYYLYCLHLAIMIHDNPHRLHPSLFYRKWTHNHGN
jgi:hypothetical protein